jgi:hypothetical protein
VRPAVATRGGEGGEPGFARLPTNLLFTASFLANRRIFLLKLKII